jgi:hypothetical protein
LPVSAAPGTEAAKVEWPLLASDPWQEEDGT